MIFDLVRNGHAHEYSTKPSITKDGKILTVGSYGVKINPNLLTASKNERLSDHLSFHEKSGQITLRPDILFHDVWSAIEKVGLDKESKKLEGEIDRKIDSTLQKIQDALEKKKKILEESKN